METNNFKIGDFVKVDFVDELTLKTAKRIGRIIESKG